MLALSYGLIFFFKRVGSANDESRQLVEIKHELGKPGKWLLPWGLGRVRLEGFPAIQPTAYPQRLERFFLLLFFFGGGGEQPSLDV